MSDAESSIDAGPAGRLHLHAFLPDGEPSAVLQVIHGMAEHGGRYAAVARALNDRGVAVYAPDLPGHGRTVAYGGRRGHFADRDGWQLALAAVLALHGAVRARHPGVPLVVLGHSMGSFLVQHALRQPSYAPDGVILSGTTIDMGPMRALGAALMSLLCTVGSPQAPSALGERLSFAQFNRRFAPTRTAFDWLSRDSEEVDAYVADPYCGHRCSRALWRDLLRAGADLGDPRMLARWPVPMPVLLVAGSEDPVCGGAAGPRQLAEALDRAGRGPVTVRIWPGARHELLHETCRDEVAEVIAGFIGNLCRNRQSKQPLPRTPEDRA